MRPAPKNPAPTAWPVQDTRVSGPVRHDSVVTVAIIEQDPKTRTRKVSYGTVLYLGLAIVGCVCIALLCCRRDPGKDGQSAQTDILILDQKEEPDFLVGDNVARTPDGSDDESSINDQDSDSANIEMKTYYMKERRAEMDRVNDLSDEQCKEIYDVHMLSSKTRGDLTYEEGTKEVDIRLSQPWVEGMKQKLAEHKSKILKHLYEEFESLTTVQIAVYLAHLSRYLGWKHKGTKRESGKTLFVSIMFSRALFRLIIHDKKMRKYLAYRGLRSQLRSEKWGTIIYTFSRMADGSDAKGSGWRWISDKDGMCYRVNSYGQEGTWYSVYESPAQKKDTNGTGVSSFEAKKTKTWSIKGPMKRIFRAGRRAARAVE